ncbi:MAG: hypothetical protein ACYS1A_17280 [Planctomycetota bacterium]
MKKEDGARQTHPKSHQAVIGIEPPQAHQTLDDQPYASEHRKQQAPSEDNGGYGKNELDDTQLKAFLTRDVPFNINFAIFL